MRIAAVLFAAAAVVWLPAATHAAAPAAAGVTSDVRSPAVAPVAVHCGSHAHYVKGHRNREGHYVKGHCVRNRHH